MRGEAIPIGCNCNTAAYLKASNSRRAAFPFDWVFSSPDMVAHAISDEFRAFLDPGMVLPVSDDVAGHALYHGRFFNHRSPIHRDNLDYYARAADRMLERFHSREPLSFFVTMLPEPEKRPGWAGGFTRGFSRPSDDPVTMLSAMRRLCATRRAETHFAVVRIWTECPSRSVTIRQQTTDVRVADIQARGANNGVQFVEAEDHAACKALYAQIFARTPPVSVD